MKCTNLSFTPRKPRSLLLAKIVTCFAASILVCDFSALRSRYSPDHRGLQQPQFALLPVCRMSTGEFESQVRPPRFAAHPEVLSDIKVGPSSRRYQSPAPLSWMPPLCLTNRQDALDRPEVILPKVTPFL